MTIRSVMHAGLWLAIAAPALTAAAAPAGQGMAPMRFLAGTWDCAGKFPASGKPIASTIRFDFDVGGEVLVKHHDDKPPGAYHAIENWVAKRDGGYAAAIVDAYSAVREFDTSGWHGNVLTWQSGPGIVPEQRFVYSRLGRDTFRLDWGVSKDGKTWTVGDTLTCKRRTA
jgi:hypothetical protein